jgi:hypothetical protein
VVRGLAGEVAGRRRRSIVYRRDIRVLAGGFQAFDDQGGDGPGAANRARWVAYRWPLRSYPWENTPVSHRHRNRNRGSATYPALLAAFVGTVGASFAHEVGVGSRSAAAIAALQVGRVDGRSRTLPGRLSSGQTHLAIFFLVFMVFISIKSKNPGGWEREKIRAGGGSQSCVKTGGRTEPWGEEESKMEKGTRGIYNCLQGRGPGRVVLMRLPR